MAIRNNALTPKEPELTVENNWMHITIGYGQNIILPVKEATQILSLLINAYELKDEYQKKAVIQPLSFDITSKFISGERYRELKRNYVLGVNDDDSSNG